MLKTVSITVSGIVQGVFYRQSTKELATALNIKGQVRNKPDDTVEIIATGTAEQIEQLVKWCWSGPPRAQVTNVIVKELPLQSFDKFTAVR
ncbi:MAG: acylphosphatase [Chitinophagales bacterium]